MDVTRKLVKNLGSILYYSARVRKLETLQTSPFSQRMLHLWSVDRITLLRRHYTKNKLVKFVCNFDIYVNYNYVKVVILRAISTQDITII